MRTNAGEMSNYKLIRRIPLYAKFSRFLEVFCTSIRRRPCPVGRSSLEPSITGPTSLVSRSVGLDNRLHPDLIHPQRHLTPTHGIY